MIKARLIYGTCQSTNQEKSMVNIDKEKDSDDSFWTDNAIKLATAVPLGGKIRDKLLTQL